jgi:hypothetical protein
MQERAAKLREKNTIIELRSGLLGLIVQRSVRLPVVGGVVCSDERRRGGRP